MSVCNHMHELSIMLSQRTMHSAFCRALDVPCAGDAPVCGIVLQARDHSIR